MEIFGFVCIRRCVHRLYNFLVICKATALRCVGRSMTGIFLWLVETFFHCVQQHVMKRLYRKLILRLYAV